MSAQCGRYLTRRVLTTFATTAVAAAGLLTGVVGPSGSAIAASSHKTQFDATVDATVASTRLVNYYPAEHAWSQMWTDWRPKAIARDMKVAKSLGANTIRIITFPYTMGYPTVSTTMEARLVSTLSMARSAGLTVQLTLFDHWGQYSQSEQSAQWTQSVLGPIKSNPALRFIEVQNEVNAGSAAQVAWVKSEIADVHYDAPGVPVTVSAANQLAGLIGLKKALGSTTPDFWDLHYYGSAQQAYRTFQQAKTLAGSLPLLVGEGGFSTNLKAAGAGSTAAARDEQLSWYTVVEEAALESSLPPVAPWTLFDFAKGAIPYAHAPADQHAFGLFSVNGKPKPAVTVIRQAFNGTLRPHVINQALVPLSHADSVPQQWRRYYPSGSMRVARGEGTDNSNAMFFHGTKVQHGGESSFYVVPMQPVVHGAIWSASVMARGSQVRGANSLGLAWYGSSNQWLGNSSSNQLPHGTSTWRRLSVSAAVPAGATSVRVYVLSTANSGSTWFSQPTWSASRA